MSDDIVMVFASAAARFLVNVGPQNGGAVCLAQALGFRDYQHFGRLRLYKAISILDEPLENGRRVLTTLVSPAVTVDDLRCYFLFGPFTFAALEAIGRSLPEDKLRRAVIKLTRMSIPSSL